MIWRDRSERTIALGVLVLVLLFFGLGSYGLLEDNEARFFEISWEMQKSGDWLTPHLNFISHFHKPPGTFWLVGSSLAIFGESEWAGRLPVAFAALITTGLVGMLATRERDSAAGLRSMLVLVTCIEFWFLSRLVLTDMFLAVSVMAAFAFAWQSRQRVGWRYSWLGFWLALGLSALFKGPVGLVIVFPVLGLHSLWTRGAATWSLRPWLGLPVFLAIAAPWYVAVCLSHDGLFEYFLNFQTAQRLMTTVHGRGGPWYFFFPVLIAGFFPWSLGLPAAMLSAYRRGNDFDKLLLCWIVFPFVFFSFSGSKLPTYLLPIFPALAMLTARMDRDPGGLRRAGGFCLGSVAFLAVALAVFLKVGHSVELQPAWTTLWVVVALGGLGLLAALGSRQRLDDDLWFASGGVVFAGILLLLASALGPCDGAYSARQVAERIRRHSPGVGAVAEVSDHLHGLPYYLNRRIISVDFPRETQFDHPADSKNFLFPNVPALTEALGPGNQPVLVMRRSDYEVNAYPQWSADDAKPWLILWPDGGTPPESEP